MSLPPYPRYKDSGVEWLGKVPVDWSVTTTRQLIRRIESGVSVNSTDVPAAEGELGVLKTSCVYHGEFDPAENKGVVRQSREDLFLPDRLWQIHFDGADAAYVHY